MAKLYFRYGTMDSSKTARLLMDAHEYKQRGESVLLIKPSLDTRSPKGKIVSRVGLSDDCLDVDDSIDIYVGVKNLIEKPACIFVDESQFLTLNQVIQLRMIVDVFNIPVMCYGLKTDFLGRLFTGSQCLFAHANRFEEIKTICRHDGCRNKAMYNVRFKDGLPVFEGDSVQVGEIEGRSGIESGEVYYIPKCSKHYFTDYNKFLRGESHS
ncbi:thymidine kinase [Bacillus pumilus]|uniref:thymidine kinase n=1 Tax=Bacillus pumilus TaxID=1408 RepID=UPI00119D78D5|nr:thymidine kinase [Bacillus pumilus]